MRAQINPRKKTLWAKTPSPRLNRGIEIFLLRHRYLKELVWIRRRDLYKGFVEGKLCRNRRIIDAGDVPARNAGLKRMRRIINAMTKGLNLLSGRQQKQGPITTGGSSIVATWRATPIERDWTSGCRYWGSRWGWRSGCEWPRVGGA